MRPTNSSVVVLIKAKDVKEPTANQIDKSIYATETKAGITKLKNSITGNAEDAAITEKAASEIKGQILGVGQSLQNMTGQRQANKNYENTTGRAITLQFSNAVTVEVGGQNVTSNFFIIPPNTTYKAAVFSANATNTITSGQITFHKAIGKPVSYSPLYHKSYQGQGEGTLTNVIRGTKNFHDGQWLGWLGDDVTLTLDLGETTEVSEVRIGAMDAQSSGIYFPERLTVALSADGKNYREVAAQEEPCTIKGKPSLKDFVLKFDPQSTRYLQIQLKNVKTPPKGGDAWLFIDEILVL